MSSELFLQCFKNKRLQSLPVTEIERIFGADITSRADDEDGGPDSLWRVDNRQGGRSLVHLRRSGDEVTGLMLNGATGAVFDRLFELIRETQSVVYWPGGTRYVVADDVDLSTHLPDNFLDIFPTRLTVRSGAEFEERVCG